MSDYIRTTRECPVREFPPEILQVIQSYFQEHKLGHLESETLISCEVISRRKRTGKLLSWLNGNSDTTIYMGMLLTSDWLIWVRRGDQSGIRLNAASLKEIQASFYTSLFTRDAGLEILGYIEEGKSLVRGYLGMGSDLAAQKFCEEVRQAIQRANPPPPAKKGFQKWLGGR